jgi:hypothetical protein
MGKDVKLTEDIKKFIDSDYGQKLLKDAKKINAEFFTFGGKRWPMRQLALYIK